jgi:hypothetical protein
MNAQFKGIFIGAEPELEIQKDGNTYNVSNCTFQECDEYEEPIAGKYLVIEFWNDNINKLKNLRIGDKVEAAVEVITRRKHNRPEKYRNRITLVSLAKI